MTYNMTGIASNSTSLLSFMNAINTELMFGHLGNILLISLTMIIFGSFMHTTKDTAKSMIGTTFIAFLLSLLLRATGLIGNMTMFITLAVAALIIGFSFKK